MKYETPELNALAPAASAIQGTFKGMSKVQDNPTLRTNEAVTAYEDWE